VDYRTGEGFVGFAGGALPQDLSRSINAVADVWHTIFANSVTGLDVARADVRGFYLNAIEFHLTRTRPNIAEASESLARLREANLLDADTYKAAGDLFFAANLEERAMEQYEAALALEPGRRDVMEKVAQYYVQKGERAQQEKRLEDAAEAFQSAQQANPLHPDAQRKLIEARDNIEDRDARLQQARQAIGEGDSAMSDAQTAAFDSNFAEAITKLRLAQRAYATVTNEFPVEAETAQSSLREADLLMREYKGDLITNAQSLSGSGFPNDARRLAENAEDIGEEALRSMLDREYRNAVQTLRQQLQDTLARPQP
jgi:tetratricopeptide (TPR) repeat protein